METGIRKLGKNRYAIRVNAREARTGRKVNRKATVTGTLDDARRARDELRGLVRSTSARPRRIRLQEYAPRWLEQRVKAGKVGESTATKYMTSLEQHIFPALGDIYLDALRPTDVKRYVADRFAAVGIKGGNTVRNEVRLLRTIAKDSVADGLCESDWCARVSMPPAREYDEEAPNMLTATQLAAVINAIPKQWMPLVMLMTTTGLRIGEALGLRWDDLDYTEGVIRTRRTNWKGRAKPTKTRKSKRDVALLPEVSALLGPPQTGLLFPVTRGDRVGEMHKGSPLRDILNAAVVSAGLATWDVDDKGKPDKERTPVGVHVTAHGLRRTFNNLARQHTSAQVLRSITGHTTEAMTEHYSIVGVGEKAEVQRKVAESTRLQLASPERPDKVGG